MNVLKVHKAAPYSKKKVRNSYEQASSDDD
jgi:hypothetical protein